MKNHAFAVGLLGAALVCCGEARAQQSMVPSGTALGYIHPQGQRRPPLGALGRIILRDMPDGRHVHVSCEVAKVADDPDGPTTMRRRAIF